MDLDWALTFIIGAASLLSGAAAVRSRAWRWLGVQIGNLAVLGLAWLFARGWVAAIAGPFWLLTVVTPSVATSAGDRFARAEKHGVALWLARIAATLHPNPATRFRVLTVAVQRAELTNDPAIVKPALARLAAAKGGVALAQLLELRFEERWAEVRAWIEAQEPRIVDVDGVALSFYLRALGETGDRDALVRVVSKSFGTPAYHAIEGQAMLFVAGFTGLEDATDRILAVHFPTMPADGKRLWRATAARAAGKDVDAELDAIARSPHLRIAAVARTRKTTPLPERRETDAAFTARFAALVAALEPSRAPPFFASATVAFCAINLYVFVRELPGGTTSAENLFALGALDTSSLTTGSAFRLVTAAVLHAGALHLVMNTLGLLALGLRLEALIGRWRMAVVYVASGVGANLLAVLATAVFHREPHHVVGASGCVMGIAGALLVRRAVLWRRNRTPIARAEMLWLLALILIQVVFDTLTPIVAGSVHLFGAGVGAAVAMLVGPWRGAKRVPAIRRSFRMYFVSLAGVFASAVALEALWAREGTTRLDERWCLRGDTAACERTCEALFGPEAMKDALVTPLPAPRVRGPRLRRLATSCGLLGEEIVVRADAGVDEELRAFAIFGATCDAGSVPGCVRLGMMLDEGRFVARDHQTAMSLFDDACDAGLPRACRYYGVGLGMDGHEAAGRAVLESTCDAGDPGSCAILDNLK